MCRYIGGLKAALNSPVSLLRSLVETQPPSTPLVKPSEIEVTCSLVKPCTLTVACPLSVLLRKLYMHCVETHKKCCCIPACHRAAACTSQQHGQKMPSVARCPRTKARAVKTLRCPTVLGPTSRAARRSSSLVSAC